jgi:KaiC/GvpD/RAD55 family RecA-like ATPase
MSERGPMASSTRALGQIWSDFERDPDLGRTPEERKNIMEPFVRDRILHYVFSAKDNPWDGAGRILENIKFELEGCDSLYTDLELSRMVGQEIAYAVEEWRKPPMDAFRVGSRYDFLNRYLDETYSPDMMRANLAELSRTVKGWRGHPAVEFGIFALDVAFGGIYPGEICVVAGTPGSMKTSLALHAVEDFVARTDQFACYYSLDMPRAMIAERLAIRESGICERDFRLQLADGMPQAIEAQKSVYRRYGERLAIKGHSVGDYMTVDTMLHDAAARMPGLVVVDYLTRLKPAGQSDLEFIEPAMNKIHSFASMYQIPFLVLTQMSRASRSDQAAGRVGGHSRGGGIVEELAYTEIELQKQYMPEGETMEGDSDPIIASVTKARHGVAGQSYFLEKDGELMKFTGRAIRVTRASKKKAAFKTSRDYADMLLGASHG